jgi:hypothetical protein
MSEAVFDWLTGRFASVCLPGVKSQPQDGEWICTDLTDLTDNLSWYMRACGRSPVRTLSRYQSSLQRIPVKSVKSSLIYPLSCDPRLTASGQTSMIGGQTGSQTEVIGS